MQAAYLLSDGDIAIRERVRPQHARLDVLVLVHLQVFPERDLGSLALADLFELRPHLEEVVVRAVAAVEPRG